MADKHPYTPTQSYIVQTLSQFRKTFPAVVNAAILQRLGLAPSNESYVINIVRFLELIDQEGNRTESAQRIFSLHDNEEFKKEFGTQIKKSYSELFDLRGEGAWDLESSSLISFFRSADKTTSSVGKLQAATFQSLATFAGHGEVSSPKASTLRQKPLTSNTKKANSKAARVVSPEPQITLASNEPDSQKYKSGNFGLTVRIEINLPASGDQSTYDMIFKSIRENLLNG